MSEFQPLPSGPSSPDQSAARVPSTSEAADPTGDLSPQERREWHLGPDDLDAPLPTGANLDGISPQQVRALQVLANGMSVVDAANAARVSRTTVYRWLNRDPRVRALHNRWKLTAVESAANRLLALQDIAVEVIGEQIEVNRNGWIALRVLERLGALRPPRIGAASVAGARREIELEDRARELEFARRENELQTEADDLTRPPENEAQSRRPASA